MTTRVFMGTHILAAMLLLGGCSDVWGNTDDLSPADDDSAGDDDTAADDDTAGDDDTADDDDMADDDDTGDDDADPPPSGYMYAHTDSELFEVLPTAPYALTPLGSFIGNLPNWGFTDFAIDTTGTMYASSFDAIYQVAPATLQVTLIATLAGGTLNSLTALADGTLLAGSQDRIYRVDPVSASVTMYGTIPGWHFAGDMVGLPDGLLYCLVQTVPDYASPTTLIVFDPADGSIVEKGPTGYGAMYGVGYAEDKLFGFNDQGQILEINRVTGAASVVSSAFEPFWGAATNPTRW